MKHSLSTLVGPSGGRRPPTPSVKNPSKAIKRVPAMLEDAKSRAAATVSEKIFNLPDASLALATGFVPIASNPEELAAMTPEKFEEWLASILPDTDGELRGRAWKALMILMDRGHHADALQIAGIVWQQLYHLIRRCPSFKVEYQAVLSLVEFRRKIEREEAADQRAIEGWLEPVFGRLGRDAGVGQVGVIRRYSDRLLKIQLFAGDPKRYEKQPETKSREPAAAIHYHVQLERSLPEANPPRPVRSGRSRVSFP